jgi:hypothetical protein
MSTPDYPAAHSMDSAWFAVDRTGLVALFETGEAGAMPESAVTLYDPGMGDDDTVGEALREALVCEWLRRAGAPQLEGKDELARAVEGDRFLVALGNAEEATAAGLRPAGEVWLTAAGTSPAALKKLRELASYVGSRKLDLYDVMFSDEFSGMFVRFGNDDYGVPGAYTRDHVPDDPLRREHLDPDLVGKLDHIDVEFTTLAELQLADHFDEDECFSWDEIPLRGGEEY